LECVILLDFYVFDNKEGLGIKGRNDNMLSGRSEAVDCSRAAFAVYSAE